MIIMMMIHMCSVCLLPIFYESNCMIAFWTFIQIQTGKKMLLHLMFAATKNQMNNNIVIVECWMVKIQSAEWTQTRKATTKQITVHIQHTTFDMVAFVTKMEKSSSNLLAKCQQNVRIIWIVIDLYNMDLSVPSTQYPILSIWNHILYNTFNESLYEFSSFLFFHSSASPFFIFFYPLWALL